jgi:AcrR family transcriptional regulator
VKETNIQTDKKEHIINIAVELFSTKGFEGTSIRELAAKAGVNIAMVNYYFGSKEKLFEALIENKVAYMKGKLEELVANKSLSEIEKIDVIIESYVERLLSQPAYHRVIHQELLVNQRESMHQSITNIFKRNMEMVKSIINVGIKKKVFKKVDPELTMASIIGTINQVMLSKAMCLMLIEKGEDFDPYTNKAFRKRLETHLKQMIHSYLLIN